MEVDFIVGDEIALKVKSSAHVTDQMLKGLRALDQEKIIKHRFVVTPDTV